MKAVVLAAGEGSRMRPLTYSRPKGMVPIANKPILENLLIELKRAGLDEFLFIVGYHDEVIRNYFGDGSRWQASVGYVNQRRQLGTAHALQTVAELAGESFLLVNGDIVVSSEDIKRLLTKETPAIGIVEMERLGEVGVVQVEKGRVIGIVEKAKEPPSHLVNAGVYYFDRRVFEAASRVNKSPRGEYELPSALQLMIDGGIPVSYETFEHWLDVSCPWDLLVANETLLNNVAAENLGEIEKGAVVKGKVAIGKGSVVKAGSYIVGPVIIGQNCDIGPNCYIRPSTTIGDECHIGASVEVKNSIIMKGSKVPHLSYVGDSVVGEGCNFGAGAKVANLRLDKAEISVGGVKTGRRKLGAIIGDHVEIGINACINVGTLIGDNSAIGPGATVSGIILPDSKIF